MVSIGAKVVLKSNTCFWVYQGGTWYLIENHQVVTHPMLNIGQWCSTINLPNGEKKPAPKPLKIVLLIGKCMIEVMWTHVGHQNAKARTRRETQCWTPSIQTKTRTCIQPCTKFADFEWDFYCIMQDWSSEAAYRFQVIKLCLHELLDCIWCWISSNQHGFFFAVWEIF